MKKKIVEKASSLFYQYGYKSVTMDDIAEDMRISKKTIYNYFDDKNSLVSESVLFIFHQVKNNILRIRNSIENPIEALYEIKKIAVQVLGRKDKSPQYQLQKFYPSIYNEIRKKELLALGKSFEMSLKKGMIMGLFRPSLDTKFITLIYFNGFRGLRDIDLFPPNEYEIDEIIGNFIDYHLRAIVTKKGLKFLESYNENVLLE